MRKLMGIGLLFCISASACVDDQAAQRQAIQKQLQEVLALMAQVEQKVVPEGQETESRLEVDGKTVTQTTANLQAYRNATLTEASQKLEKLLKQISSSGSVPQQVVSRRLLADVCVAQVRYQTQQALVDWSDLADREAALLSYLGKIRRADSNVRLFDEDVTPLLKKLDQNKKRHQNQIKQFLVEIGQINKRLIDLNQRKNNHNAEALKARAEAEEIIAQAMRSSQTHEQYDLHDQAVTVERQADVASAKAQQLQSQIEAVQSERGLLKKQVNLARQAVQNWQEKIDTVQKQQNLKLQDKALDEKDKVVQEMIVQFNKIIEDYAKTVQIPLDNAVEKIDDAIGLLNEAADMVSTQQKKQLHLDQLTQMVNKTNILTGHVLTAGSHGHTLTAINQQARKLMPNHSVFRDKAKKVYDKQRSLIEKAKQSINNATELSKQIIGQAAGDNLFANNAKKHAERLEEYRRRIEDLRLPVFKG